MYEHWKNMMHGADKGIDYDKDNELAEVLA
jgi:hypothetical protein